MSTEIFSNPDFATLYQLQEKLELVGTEPFYLKISGSGSNQKVVIVQGRLWRFFAYIATLFGSEAYNINRIKEVVFHKLEGVEKASERLSNVAIGKKVTHSCDHIQQVFFSAIASEACRNEKLDDNGLQVRMKSVIQMMQQHFQPAPKPSTPKPAPPQPAPQKPVDTFFAKNQDLIAGCLGKKATELQNISPDAARLKALENWVQKKCATLVGIVGSPEMGELAKLLDVGKKWPWSSSPFQKKETLDGSSFLLARLKLEPRITTSINSSQENRLADCKQALEAILQAEALLTVHVAKQMDPQTARALLTLELEAAMTRILETHPDAEEIKGLLAMLQSSDIETIAKSTLEMMVEKVKGLSAWGVALETRLAGIVDKKIEKIEPIQVEELNQEAKEALLQKTLDQVQTALLKVGIDAKELVSEEEAVDDKINLLIFSIIDQDKEIDESLEPLNVLYKKIQKQAPDSVSEVHGRLLLNNLVRSSAREPYDPAAGDIRKRLEKIQEFALFLNEADLLKASDSHETTFSALEAKRAVLLMQLRHLALKLNIDLQSTFWSKLADDPMYDPDKPYGQERLTSVTTAEVKSLYDTLAELRPNPSAFKDEWQSHYDALVQFEKSISLENVKTRDQPFEIEKNALAYIKKQAKLDSRFLVEAKYFQKKDTKAVGVLVLRQFLLEAEEFLAKHPLHPLQDHMEYKISQLYQELGGKGPFSDKRLSSIQHEELAFLAVTCIESLKPLRSYLRGDNWTEYDREKRAIKSLLLST